MLGARILEKHFTLDKTKPGNDHYHAMDPDDIRNFRKQCDFVTSLLGQYHKEVLPCEQEARKQARRSLVAAQPLAAGTVITEKDLMIKRPGTGISPEYLDVVLGKKAIRDIKEDELLQWEMFLNS
jgi:N-acetylneuraminate synthase